jgi:hypothetical protein
VGGSALQTQAAADARYLQSSAAATTYVPLAGGSVMTGLLGPTTTATRDLGTTALRWAKLWATDADFTNPPTVGGAALSTLYLPLVGGTLTGALVEQGAAATTSVHQARVSGDAQARFTVDASGTHAWGPGGATATDTTLQRTGAGALAIANLPAAGGGLAIDGPAASTRYVAMLTGGVNRWAFATNATAEGGANAGSDFIISRYADGGGALGAALALSRAAGSLSLSPDPGHAAVLTGVGTAQVWQTGYSTVQAGIGGALYAHGTYPQVGLAANTYYDGAGATRAVANGLAARLLLAQDGNLYFANAPNASAGATHTLTTRFTLNQVGTLTLSPDAGVAAVTGPNNTVTTTSVLPVTDNAYIVGGPSNRWNVVYAATGTINTSLAEAKTGIAPLDPAVAMAAVRATQPATFDYKSPTLDAEWYDLPLDPEAAYDVLYQRNTTAPLEAGARHQAGFVLGDTTGQYPTDPLFETGTGQSNAANSVGVLLAALKGLDARVTALEPPPPRSPRRTAHGRTAPGPAPSRRPR